MPSSHDAPPATLDRALEVGSNDWAAPGFYQLMTALVVPRPVGWISTISAAGVPNVAPYSYFNLMGSDPPYVAFGSSGVKDSLANLREVPELARLRLSSIDSVEAGTDLLDAIADEPRLMPHLHLSLQAGDDLILKRMKRRHSRSQAIAFCDQVRRLRPDVAFGADMIAGFPTETDDMFARSLDLVDECGLTSLHVFPFSPRPGTPAARMPQVPRVTVKDRARRLREKGAAALRGHLDPQIGAHRLVLTERGGIGRTEQFTPVRLAIPAVPGDIVDVMIKGHDGRRLLAA